MNKPNQRIRSIRTKIKVKDVKQWLNQFDDDGNVFLADFFLENGEVKMEAIPLISLGEYDDPECPEHHALGLGTCTSRNIDEVQYIIKDAQLNAKHEGDEVT